LLTEERVVEILNLHREGWKVGTIAKQLRIHHDTVKSYIERKTEKECPAETSKASVIEPWLSLITTTLEKYPKVRATRLLSMLRQRGYKGSIYPIRRHCSQNRSRKDKAFLDLHFTPGEMAQVDWADFGRISIRKHHRKLYLFIMVLAYSRRIFGHFFHDMCTARVLEGHVLAFSHFGGVTRQVLYDNMKTAVIEHVGEGVRFNEDLNQIAQFYAFLPRACNPRSGWEKGRVERAVRYVRENFFEARSYEGLDDLNTQLGVWLNTDAMDRDWPDDRLLSVRDAFELENLGPLPLESFDPCEERTVRVDKKAMIQFDTNRYPVRPEYAGKQLILRATHSKIRIMTESHTLHNYPRLWSKNETLLVTEHQEEIARNRKIKKYRVARSALETSLSCGKELVLRWAELEDNIQRSSKQILELVTLYGAASVEAASRLAIDNGTPRACSIAQILAESQAAPTPNIHIKLQSEVPEISIEWPSVSAYDDLY